MFNFPLTADTAHDTAPDDPWSLVWCEECGTVTCFKATTPHGSHCGTCYLRKQAAGKAPTMELDLRDTEQDWCDCSVCRSRRIRTVLNHPGMRKGTQPTTTPATFGADDEEALLDDDSVDLDELPPYRSLVQDIPDWVPERILPTIADGLVERFAEVLPLLERDEDVDMLSAIAERLQVEPKKELTRKLTPPERRMLSRIGFVTRTDVGFHSGPDAREVHLPEGTSVMDMLDLTMLTPTAVHAARRLIDAHGETFLAPREDARAFVGEFAEKTIHPFVTLTTGRDTGSNYDLGDFMLNLLGGATFPSFQRIMTMLYCAVHPDELDTLESASGIDFYADTDPSEDT